LFQSHILALNSELTCWGLFQSYPSFQFRAYLLVVVPESYPSFQFRAYPRIGLWNKHQQVSSELKARI
jgi:hypothetical protein